MKIDTCYVLTHEDIQQAIIEYVTRHTETTREQIANARIQQTGQDTLKYQAHVQLVHEEVVA